MIAGELIRSARLDAGLTQAQLADGMGTSQSAVARLEGTRRNITIGTLDRALRATGHRLTLGSEEFLPNVDPTLIARNLRRSPAERLRNLETAQDELGELRGLVRGAECDR